MNYRLFYIFLFAFSLFFSSCEKEVFEDGGGNVIWEGDGRMVDISLPFGSSEQDYIDENGATFPRVASMDYIVHLGYCEDDAVSSAGFER